jgi:hypothetical protein
VKNMIDLKEAMEKAKQFIVEMEGEQDDLHLEAALLSNDKKSWSVTYSYRRNIENPNDLQKVLGMMVKKIYKKVILDSESKEIIGYYDRSYDKSEAA